MKKQSAIKLTKSLHWPCLAAAFLSTTGLYGAPITWVGDVDSNWSTDSGPGDTNWDTNTLPGALDTAIFNDVVAGTQATVVDSGFGGAINFLTINQSTTTATNKITLGRNLVVDANDASGSGITYGSTISNAAMFELDLAGFSLNFTSNHGDGVNNNLYGTYTMGTAGSRIRATRSFGTGGSDLGTFNIGNGSNLAAVNVTAAAEIGFRSDAGNNTTNNNTQLSRINIGAGSEVNISNNATLSFLKRQRVATNVKTLQVDNSGTINLASGSTLELRHIQINTNNNNVGLELNNLASGTVNHNGTVAMTMPDRGNSTINNAGTWNVGTASVISGELGGQGSGDTGVVSFNNQSTGLITGASATTALSYTPLDTATFLNQRLTIANAGIISAGVGHDGSGTASVGNLGLTAIDIDASTVANTFRFDLASTSNFDVINMNSGALALGSGFSVLDVYFVDGFAPIEGNSFAIFTNSTITGNFSTINLFNGTGDAADSNNWSFNNTNGVLSMIPEPSSAALLGLGLCGLALRRRR